MASLSDFENQKISLASLHKMALQLIHHSVSLKSPVFTSSTYQWLWKEGTTFSPNGSCVSPIYMSNRKGQQFGVTKELVEVHISKNKCGHNLIWKRNAISINLLITLRVALEIFPIRKVQGFATPLLFLGRHFCLSCGKISQPGLVYKL